MKYSPHVHMELQVCVLFTYYGACVLILDINLPEQPALIVLIHGAWKQDKRPMNTIIKSHSHCYKLLTSGVCLKRRMMSASIIYIFTKIKMYSNHSWAKWAHMNHHMI